MCIRDSTSPHVFIPLQKLALTLVKGIRFEGKSSLVKNFEKWSERINFEEKTQTLARLLCRDGTYVGLYNNCLLYTSDAADERSSVDLGGRRIIKKKKNRRQMVA